MSPFTVELVSNASIDCYPNNTSSSFTNFLPEQINLDGEWEVTITELSYPSLYQNITEGKFIFIDEATPDTKRIITHFIQVYTPRSLMMSMISTEKKNAKCVKKRQSSHTLTKLRSEFL